MSCGGRRFPLTTAGKAESRRMEPRVNVITLAVDDLERALEFYRDGLGLQTNGPVATELQGRSRPIYSGYFRGLDGHLWEVIWSHEGAA